MADSLLDQVARAHEELEFTAQKITSTAAESLVKWYPEEARRLVAGEADLTLGMKDQLNLLKESVRQLSDQATERTRQAMTAPHLFPHRENYALDGATLSAHFEKKVIEALDPLPDLLRSLLVSRGFRAKDMKPPWNGLVPHIKKYVDTYRRRLELATKLDKEKAASKAKDALDAWDKA